VQELDGFLWTIKPRGLKPMAFLSKVKSALGVKKLAMWELWILCLGLMPVCIGRACRFSDFFFLYLRPMYVYFSLV